MDRLVLVRKKDSNSRQGNSACKGSEARLPKRGRICWSSELGLGGVEVARDGKGQRMQNLENRLRKRPFHRIEEGI